VRWRRCRAKKAMQTSHAVPPICQSRPTARTAAASAHARIRARYVTCGVAEVGDKAHIEGGVGEGRRVAFARAMRRESMASGARRASEDRSARVPSSCWWRRGETRRRAQREGEAGGRRWATYQAPVAPRACNMRLLICRSSFITAISPPACLSPVLSRLYSPEGDIHSL